MRKTILSVSVAIIVSVLAALNCASGQQQYPVPTFADASAIFSKYHCTLCHGSAKASDGLALHTYESLMRGSRNGPVIIRKEPAKSILIRQIKGEKEPRMPINGPPWVTDGEVQILEKWIAVGAPKE
ncbi:MAG: hypothetical protein GX422_05445 [Deltaproteobacteria bacterium]|jgi:cytochrome c551/c552|nr:hypothetical protein [Deltaproteobacteria bacterium]